ncbi:MAG: hypothetical protein DI534_06535, partial [Leifsonia xyli]
MLRPVIAAISALALVFGALVLPATVGEVTAASAAGTGSLYPASNTSTTCAATDTNGCRATIEWRTSAYGPASGTNIKRRTFFNVYAVAGERILLGSSSMAPLSTGSGQNADIVMWNPGVLSETDVKTVANSALPTPNYSCRTQRGASTTMGSIFTRTQELAGANSITGNANPTGYTPCYYVAPSTGIYRLAFYGTGGNNVDSDTPSPNGLVVPTTTNFENPGSASWVYAWDVSVRPADNSGTAAAAAGRYFTYSFALSMGGGGKRFDADLYLNTTDGYKYRIDTNGIDPAGFVFYGNRTGFVDSDGTPLNRDILGNGSTPYLLTSTVGNTQLTAPEYPLSVEPLAPEVLAALSIPTTPVNPVLNSVSYAGKKTASGSYLNQGGTFTVDTGTAGTYEIVVSRNGTNFDPGLTTNATIRGQVNAAGVYTVNWDGKDNAGNAFPVGDDYAVHSSLRGGEYHAPMLDVESSYYGGPSITLMNPPSGICPFSGATSDGTNCTRAFYDDRGYVAANGTSVGTPGGALCPNLYGKVPNPLFSDPVTGFDSTSAQRSFGAQTAANANALCPAAASLGTLGDSKGLDIWTYFPSAMRTTSADVLPLPTAPDAVNDTDTASLGVTRTRTAAEGVLANDTGSNLTVTGHTAPSSGTLTINPDGSYTYVPAGTFTGTVTSTYTVTDDAGQTDTAVLTITISPRAVDDTATTPVNTPVVRTSTDGVLANDVGTSLTVTGNTPLAAGTGSLTLNANGSYTYTPPAGFSGVATTTYTARDSNNRTATATLTIRVTPAAVNDTDTTSAGTTISRNATQGVLDDDLGSGLTVTGFTALPSNEGTLTIALDGSYTFAPAAGFSGVTTSTYTVTDAAGQTTTATLTITVNPDAVSDTVSTSYGTAVSRPAATGVLANDLGTGLTVTGATPPASGTLTIAADGSYTYTPAAGFSGIVTSTYTVQDAGGRTDTAVLTIRVGPLAVADTDSTTAGTPITRNAAAGVLPDDLGPSLTVTGYTQPASGTLTIAADGSYSYTPAAGFSGQAVANYTITDGNGLTDSTTLTITVTPVAVNDTDSTTAGTPITRAAAAGVLPDDTGSGLTVTGFTLPASGTLTIAADGSYSYTPAAGFSGVVSSTYTVTDSSGQTTTATLTITVNPLAVDDTDATTAGTSITRTGTDNLLGDDLGTGLTVTGVSSTPAGVGTLTVQPNGDYSYTPAGGYSGTFTVDYTVTDAGGRTDVASLTITVSPLAVNDTDSTTAGTAITRNAAAGVLTDDRGTGLTVTGFTPIPVGEGTLSIAANGSYTFTPATGFSGDVVSTYTVTDSAGGSATATLTITVTPVAVADTDVTDAGLAITRDVAAGVLADDLGSGLTVTGFTQPASGTLTIAADGSYTYTPAAGFSGDVSSTYTVTDAAGRTTTATLSIRVNPLAVDDDDSTPFEQTVTRTGSDGVLGNDLGTGLTVTGNTPVSSTRGTLTINSDGSYTFAPAPGFSGVVTSDYTIRDTAGRTDTATLTIAVGLAAVDDNDSTTVDSPITRDAAAGVLPNDGGTGLEVTDFTAPSSGTLTIAADGSYTFTPAAGFSGAVTSTYTVTDDDAQTDTAVLTIRVTPVAVNDTDATTAGTAITRNAAAGVLDDDRGSSLTVTAATAPSSGTLAIAADGSYTYTPAAGFSGQVSSTYTVRDGSGQTTTATLTITVTPVAVNDTDSTTVGTPITRASGAGVLGDDLGTGLTVTGFTPPASGTLNIAADG